VEAPALPGAAVGNMGRAGVWASVVPLLQLASAHPRPPELVADCIGVSQRLAGAAPPPWLLSCIAAITETEAEIEMGSRNR